MSDTAILTLRTMLANLDDAKKYQSLRDVMSTLPAPDLAAVFEDLPPEKLPVLFRLCPKDLAAEIFAELTPETQQGLIDGLTDKELKAVVDDLFVDDATDLVEEMPANVVKRILAQADPATRRMINELLKYPEDSAGGVMTTELMELRPDMTVAQAMEAIRQNGFDKETINNCYVTDRDRTLIGVVSLRALVLSKDPDNELIRDMMDDNVVSVSTTTDQEDVSQMFEKYGYLAIPVVDNEKRLVGIVTIDDAISIMQDEASEDIAKMNAMGPSDKPYFKQSMWELYKNRAPWLLFLMISSTFSSMVIRGYEDALAAVTVLTAYIPMLTDAGGNAGSQSTSTIIRGMAVGDIEQIPDYPVHLFFTRDGYFKKITPQSLRMSGEQKLKDGDEVLFTCESTNSVELLFFTNHRQVYKSHAYDFNDSKASVLGDYVASALGMEEGEVPLYMVVTPDYKGWMLFFYDNGKCAKVPLSSYETKQNRRKLLKAYSDKAELAFMRHLPEETELAIFTTNNRLLLVGSALIPEKTTRDTAGVSVVALKKNAKIARVTLAEGLELNDAPRYRVRTLPAAGAILKDDDRAEQLTL